MAGCTLAAQVAKTGVPEKGVLRVATWNIAAINNKRQILQQQSDVVARSRLAVVVGGEGLCAADAANRW